MDIIETKNVKKALRLAETVIASSDRRIGQIVGEPGSGKTALSKLLAERFSGIRVCCFEGISKAQLTRDILEASGATLPGGTSYDMMAFSRQILPGRLIIVDEANHLRIQQLERVRYFCDELGTAAILMGTPLVNKVLSAQATAVLTKQLTGRIGSKRLDISPMDPRELAATVLVPAFGDLGPDLSKAFHALTGGWWREALELVDGIKRIMAANKLESVTLSVLTAAKKEGAM
ncbi:ATP-binding protein [Insolitispirillum peregrinum]|uniref:ATP-binding protein n=1 Tax=Insolitispirillum peregrinum TaxID=80876 RepID=UPI0009711FC2|nr:ATP-binding protein [Insolitispirillum peregrinum]